MAVYVVKAGGEGGRTGLKEGKGDDGGSGGSRVGLKEQKRG